MLASRNPEDCRGSARLRCRSTKCAADIGEREEALLGFCVFYRLLLAQAAADAEQAWAPAPRAQLDPLPRVSARTRDAVVRRIDALGSAGFARNAEEKWLAARDVARVSGVERRIEPAEIRNALAAAFTTAGRRR